ncbi:MAG: hypothetical protein KDA24_30195, partial [Deltaproteobacteria bacterium]|nr:hypothetical protein [Deltaproteobacteria bacterium]
MRRSIVLAFALAGCSRDSGSFALPDGTEVVVTRDGEVELWIDGSPTFAVGASPETRSFAEESEGPFAIWSFERDDETSTAFTLDRVRRDGEAVEVEYTSTQGLAATLRIEADTTGSRFTFTSDGPANSIAVPVRCDDGGSFHGFGEQYSTTNQKGHALRLLVEEQGVGRQEDGFRPISGDLHTTYFPMPWWLDARGFGVLFDTKHRVEADVCATDGDLAWIEVVDDAPVTWTVFHGPTPKDVVRQLGDVVGRPKLPPDWAWGTWICTQGGEDAVR